MRSLWVVALPTLRVTRAGVDAILVTLVHCYLIGIAIATVVVIATVVAIATVVVRAVVVRAVVVGTVVVGAIVIVVTAMATMTAVAFLFFIPAPVPVLRASPVSIISTVVPILRLRGNARRGKYAKSSQHQDSATNSSFKIHHIVQFSLSLD